MTVSVFNFCVIKLINECPDQTQDRPWEMKLSTPTTFHQLLLLLNYHMKFQPNARATLKVKGFKKLDFVSKGGQDCLIQKQTNDEFKIILTQSFPSGISFSSKLLP